MIFDSLIEPLSVFSLRTGRTLAGYKSLYMICTREHLDILGWVRRVNNNSLFRLVVCNEVGVVVARPLPCAALIDILKLPSRCSYT